jgi:glycine cleavage system aminomethyltransferase T
MAIDEIIGYYKKENAKFLKILDYYFPAWFKSVFDEYNSSKKGAVFSHREDLRQIFISGEDRNRLVDKVSTVDLSKIEFYSVENAAICNEEGHIIDLIKLYVFGDGILMICSFYKSDEVLSILNQEKKDMNCEFMDISDKSSIYTFIGPEASNILAQIAGENVELLKVNQFSVESFKENEIIISRSDKYGEYTFEVMVESESDKEMLNTVESINSKSESQLLPIGIIALSILRIEKGIPTVMNDLDSANLFEVKMDNRIKFDKPDFLGKDALLEQSKQELEKSIFLCSSQTDNLIKAGQSVFNEDGKKIGYITSSAYSPNLTKTLALGFIKNSMNNENNDIYFKLDKGNKLTKAKIISPI